MIYSVRVLCFPGVILEPGDRGVILLSTPIHGQFCNALAVVIVQ
jgi:hypothetical protein